MSLLKKLFGTASNTGNQKTDPNGLPAPVRKLVLGERSEEHDLKQILGELYDQLERMEGVHESTYEQIEISMDTSEPPRKQTIDVKLKKQVGEKPSHEIGGYSRRRQKKEDTNYNLIDRSFPLAELLDYDRSYHIDRAESNREVRENDSEQNVSVEAVDGGSPDMSELVEEDSADDSEGLDIDSPIESGSEKNQSLKDTIQNHNS